MIYCAKSEPEPEPDLELDSEPEPEPETEPDPEPEPDPKPDPDLDPEPFINSQLYTPDWSSTICLHNQAKECTNVHHYNTEYWIYFNWKKTFKFNWFVINYLS